MQHRDEVIIKKVIWKKYWKVKRNVSRNKRIRQDPSAAADGFSLVFSRKIKYTIGIRSA